MEKTFFLAVLLLLSALGSATEEGIPRLDGPYLGQEPPGMTPKIFAPGIVSTGMHTRDIAISPDGREIYFCVILGQYKLSSIVGCRLEDGRWSAPRVVPGLDRPGIHYIEPHISPDGRRFFFASNLPAPGKEFNERDEDIWVMERARDGWGEPRNLGAPVNTPGGEFFPTTTHDGTLYFTGPDGQGEAIYRSRQVNGRYQAPEKMPPQINIGTARYNVWFSPDGRLAIIPAWGLPGGSGGCDYHAVFLGDDGSWSEPVNLGPAINTAASDEHSACLSPDGRYLFFMSARLPEREAMPERLTYEFIAGLHGRVPNGNPAIWWVDARIIDSLRQKSKIEKTK